MAGIKSIVQNNPRLIEGFPQTAITALLFLFQDLNNKNYLTSEKDVVLELNRIGRFVTYDVSGITCDTFLVELNGLLIKMGWENILYFCERTYSKLLKEMEYFDTYISLDAVRKYFLDEINTIFIEESINFEFIEGVIVRRGRPQTRKALESVGYVLAEPRLERVANLFNKARKAFNQRPQPDAENCVKDALCGLEACVEILTGKKASDDFAKAINQLKGNGSKHIPAPIAESMIKIHGYRGSAKGVGHAALEGNRCDSIDAEFIMSVVATYITYLVSIFPIEEEIPF